MTNDTIAAIATAPGQGGVAIVRLSGPEAEDILLRIFRPAGRKALPLTSHMLTFGHVIDGDEVVDECMAVLMRAPRSYTREDVAEIQLHGGMYLSQRVLALCLQEGARLAEPGEFTRRAFLNGRIDLSQAEAVMALISSQGEASRRAAMRQLEGGASSFIRKAADTLYELEAGAAACIDYPEEVDEDEAVAELVPKARQLAEEIEAACDERAVRILQNGLRVALCGQPNVGKSSLLNALLGEDRAIVTPIPGTTRDMVTGELLLGGSIVHLTDTAGLHATDDPVEQLGIERARKAMDEADVVLAVLDASRALGEDDRALLAGLHGRNCAIVLNKSDLAAAISPAEAEALLPGVPVMVVSTADVASLAPVKNYLMEQAAVSDRLALTQPRHVEAARRAAQYLREAAATAEHWPVDIAAMSLHAAQLALGEITGDKVMERLLDQVFGMFCVGK